MSNTYIELDLLAELTDEQQEIVAGGRLGSSLPSLGLSAPSGFSSFPLLGSPFMFGSFSGFGSQDDDGDCQRIEEQDGDTQIIRIVCQKTKKTP